MNRSLLRRYAEFVLTLAKRRLYKTLNDADWFVLCLQLDDLFLLFRFAADRARSYDIGNGTLTEGIFLLAAFRQFFIVILNGLQGL